MTIFGESITAEQISACESRMKSSPFTSNDVLAIAAASGVTHAFSLAQRLIARHRSSITQTARRQWVWGSAAGNLERRDPPAPRRGTRNGRGAALDTSNPLAELFGSRARAEVLRILFGLSGAEVYLSEIARRSGMAEQGVDEQLRIFCVLELVTSRPDGNRRYFRANTAHPFYSDLRSIVLKSSGLRDVLAAALTSPKIEIAFVFGSIARREERAESDVDLMVIGDLGHREAAPSLRPLSENLGREVNSCFFTRAEIARRVQIDEPFFTRVLSAPKLFVVGDDDGLTRLVAECRAGITNSALLQ